VEAVERELFGGVVILRIGVRSGVVASSGIGGVAGVRIGSIAGGGSPESSVITSGSVARGNG